MSIFGAMLISKTSSDDIIVTAKFPCSVQELWSAITDLHEMKQWYFPMLDSFDPVVGFKTSFTVVNEGRIFIHRWHVIDVFDKERISYDWTFHGYAGRSRSIFEVKALSPFISELKLTSQVLESHPGDVPEFRRESGVAGWQYLINESLKKYITDKTSK